MQKDHHPILSVRNLKTYFFQDEGTVKAVDGAKFDVFPQRTLGIVGESGCGKSVTSLSILRLIERPGRIVDGEIIWHPDSGDGHQPRVDLTQLDADGNDMRAIRGDQIALIFQEPMTSLSPVHRVGNQLIEAIQLHRHISKREALEAI